MSRGRTSSSAPWWVGSSCRRRPDLRRCAVAKVGGCAGAAELDTSVSALVRDFLEQVAQAESGFERRRRLQDEVLATVTRYTMTNLHHWRHPDTINSSWWRSS